MVAAEQAVLGGLLLDNAALERVHWLCDSDFSSPEHQIIFAAIRAAADAGKPCDALLLSEALAAKGELERCGGDAYIASLVFNTPSAANIQSYAKSVREHSLLRTLGALASDVGAAVLARNQDPVQIAQLVIERASAVVNSSARNDIVPFSDAVGAAVDWLDAPVKGISSGYKALDNIIEGLRPGELIIIAGRPSMGKSSLALCIAEQVAAHHPVAVFSLEMTCREIGVRALRWHEHLSDRSQAVKHLWERKLWLDDSSSLTIALLRARLRQKPGLALVVVDYLQLMEGQGDNREQEIASLSRGLKRLAKEFNVPILAVAQLNRSVEARQDKRPLLSDLRESGSVEQDADVVVMLYRDDYYHDESYAKGFCEAIVRKHRNGRTGTAWLLFQPEYARFRDFAGEPPRPPRRERATSGMVNVEDFKRKAGGDAGA